MNNAKKVLIAVFVVFPVLLALLIIISMVFFSSSVNKGPDEVLYDSRNSFSSMVTSDENDYYIDESSYATTNSTLTLERTSEAGDRNIVRTGSIGIGVDNIDKTVENIHTILTKYNAEVKNSSDSGVGIGRFVSLSIKVEETEFHQLYEELKKLDGEYKNSYTNSEDSTREVIDVKARLNNYKNTEAQLLEVLKKATTVTDTMAVYDKLTDVRYNIESLEAQLKYYEEKTDYSRIDINISQNSSGAYLEDTQWRPYGVLKEALRAFVAFLKVLGTLAIWTIVFGLPIIVIILLVKAIKKGKNKV